jgi:hypothetical protein
MDQEAYEKALRERQAEHLRKVRERQDKKIRNAPPWRPCLHDGCTQCHGTGVKADGTACVHMISCPCPKCAPTMLIVKQSMGLYNAARQNMVCQHG